MKHIFFLVVTIMAFSHCQSAPATPKNLLSCYARYDAAARYLKAETTLRDSLTLRSLAIPGGFLFQGVDMKALTKPSPMYRAEYTAVPADLVVFAWNDPKLGKEQFKMPMPSIDSFSFASTTLSNKKPAVLSWTGTPLGKGETLVFMWEDAEKSKTVPMEVSSTLGASFIELPAAKIAELEPGNWSLYLVRKRLTQAQVGNFVVNGVGEFYTRSMAVKVE